MILFEANRVALRKAMTVCNHGHMTTDYKPDEDAARLYARYRKARETEAELKPEVRELATRDLKAGATVGQLAKLTGLSDEYFRRIARAEGVEHKRPPTVGKLRAEEN